MVWVLHVCCNVLIVLIACCVNFGEFGGFVWVGLFWCGFVLGFFFWVLCDHVDFFALLVGCLVSAVRLGLRCGFVWWSNAS